MNKYDEELGRELRSRADSVSGHPIALVDVKSAAGRIRRRRAVATGAGVAAMLAVLVPMGIATNNALTTKEIPPAGPSVSATPTPTTDPTPTGLHKVDLSTDGAPRGGDPLVAYLADGAIHLPDGAEVPLAARLYSLAPFGDGGWVGIGPDASGGDTLYLFGHDGAMGDSAPSADSIAVSPSGDQLAYFDTAQGQVRTIWFGDREPEWTDVGSSSDVAPVASYSTEDCIGEAAEATCGLYWNTGRQTDDPQSRRGLVEGSESTGLQLVTDVSVDGLIAGRVSATDDGSCSAVLDQNLRELWQTCDYTLAQFSPDGRYIVGRPAYLDGLGDPTVAILDAKTGAPLAEYSSPGTAGAFVNSSVWEDGSHLLSLVWDNGWSIVRLDPSGGIELASEQLGDDPEAAPVRLAGAR